jgi:hypothetical protein
MAVAGSVADVQFPARKAEPCCQGSKSRGIQTVEIPLMYAVNMRGRESSEGQNMKGWGRCSDVIRHQVGRELLFAGKGGPVG